MSQLGDKLAADHSHMHCEMSSGDSTIIVGVGNIHDAIVTCTVVIIECS